MISFFSALVDVLIVYLVLAKKRFSVTVNWFLLFLGGAAILAIAEGLQRSSIHPEAALFWQNVSFIGNVLLPPVFYLFIVSYTSQSRRQFVLLTSVLILAISITIFFAGTGLLNSQVVQHAPWGFYSNLTQAGKVLVLYTSIFYIFGVGLLLQFRKSTHNKLIKKQALLFVVAFLLPFLAALITSVILAAVKPNVVPPLATFFGAFSALIVYYGIRKYRLFDLDPQALAQNILETMSEAVIISRPDMTIESINPEAERLLGLSAEKAVSQKLQTFFIDTDYQRILEKMTSSQSQTIDQTINKSMVKNTAGQSTPVRIAVTNLKDGGERIANIIVLSDISEITRSFDALQNSATQIYTQNDELKKLEKQLIEEKNSVEHTVEVRTKELVDAQDKLKAANQLKTEFIMLTSHNLRTPLTIAKGYADMISEYPLPKEEKAYVEGLIGGLKRLGLFVEDLLTISSIEAGDQLMLEEVPFQKVIEPLVKEVNDLALTQNDKFVVKLHAGDIKVKANATRLQGALRNVLNNACKFTKNGTVELNTSRSDNKLIINISDTGIGIDNDELPKLFTKFHRGTNVLSGGYEGEGLGLYLTKLIIEEHSGKISCVSQLGKGTTFTVELPCY